MKYVYILQSTRFPDRHYTGVTNDVEARLNDHNSCRSPHTKKHAPWKVLVYMGFADAEKAAQFEKYLKSGSGRTFAKKHF